MTNERKVAIVTGANRGLGFGIVKALAIEEPNMLVYLTARNSERGNFALEQLRHDNGLQNVFFHQLDITDDESIENFKSFLIQNHGGVDILVNNLRPFFTYLLTKYIIHI